ncbi:kelch repeat and BTB domain-containing protein 2-like isoform X2 [Amphiura filiformis]|uniref:kelch repeat and BTB domain-containing protein 2-like isoform X2 n=1 Tax=Amphiura filiformis TaxID=82378 RepID=UPI003B2100BF
MARMEQGHCVKQMGDPSHLSHLSSGLNQLRQQAAFCDVTIIVGHQKFPAHKAVLTCASDYFQGMFSSGFQESTMSEVNVPGTKESFAQILEFAYTGHFTLSVRTVLGIFKMACYMVLTKAIELCAEYLKDVKDLLTIEDCFEIWSISSNYNSLSDVAQMYRSHVIQNFLNCVKSKDFLEISSASVMMEILSDEEIETDVLAEEQILQGTVVWLKYDWEQRKAHAVDLLKKIRLGLVPVDRLQHILGDELMAIPECKEMVDEVVKLSVAKETASLIKNHLDLFGTRNTITANNLYVDDDDQPGFSVACSTERACYKLTKFADIPNRILYLESDEPENGIDLLVCEQGHLYAAGGASDVYFDDDDPPVKEVNHMKWIAENNFFRYNSEKNEWILLPPMPKVLYKPIIFHLDDYIYVIGSTWNLITEKSMIERYHIPSKTWELAADNMSLYPTSASPIDGDTCILINGEEEVECPNHQVGDTKMMVFKVVLYKQANNKWVDVSVSGNLDEDSYFSVHNNVCYSVTKGEDQEPDQIHRCISDFDSDSPTIVVAEAVEDDDIHKNIQRELRHWNSEEFTFDKRKLGMMEMPCKCDSHVKGDHQKLPK